LGRYFEMNAVRKKRINISENRYIFYGISAILSVILFCMVYGVRNWIRLIQIGF